MNHLRPLVLSEATERIWVVCTLPIPPTDKVVHVRPPSWLCRFSGTTPARLLACGWLLLTQRPDLLGGFHMLPNGLFAALAARVTGARSLYLCGGGPAEVDGGGFVSENRLFTYLPGPDAYLQRLLLHAVASCDLVITMGSRAIDYFKSNGVETTFAVIPGGVNPPQSAATSPGLTKQFDLILVGRLDRVKRIDLLLETVATLKRSNPTISAVIVGQGRLESTLKHHAEKLGVTNHVHFVGHQHDVHSWLIRSKIFVLTSDSEGLSLAVMEAMACGLPCVVSDVGEMGQLVSHGQNGFLVKERSPQAFAEPIHQILVDETLSDHLAAEARLTAYGFDVQTAQLSWNKAISATK